MTFHDQDWPALPFTPSKRMLGVWTQGPAFAAPLLLAAVAGPAVDRLADLAKRDYVKRYRVIDSTVKDFCQDYRGEKFHALLCDPPYHLTSTTKRFGGANAAPAKFGKDGAFSRASRGFMGQQWDGGDVAFDPDTWAALGEHLYPGAFGMAFASSRGWHRLAVAIEDAGFIIHPSIFGWGFGSGFPKATRIDTQIDSAAGAVRQIVQDRYARNHPVPDLDGYSGNMHSGNHTAAVTDLAKAWEGHRYGLQAMKPALEPIIVFQKPYEGRPVDCITDTGAGALWIDGARIGADERTYSGGGASPNKLQNHSTGDTGIGMMDGSGRDLEFTVNGRWPANLALIHDPRCNGSCVPECAVRRLGEQSGYKEPFGSISGKEPSTPAKNVYNNLNRVAWQAYEDEGTAARFFHNADWSHEVAEQIANAAPVRYEAKASADERSRGLDAMPWQTVNDGRQTPIDNAYQRGETQRLNPHPTVKPIGLTEWLAKLLLPPAAYGPRRLLVPFSGSGSEMIGALLAGWEQIVGIEMTMEYAQIARARLAYYADPLRTMRVAPAAPPPPAVQTAFAFAP